MSDLSNSFDPYSPPQLTPAVVPPPAARGGRPGWLTALCIISLVLGGLGLMAGIFSIISTIAAPYMQQAMMPPAGAAMDEVTRIQLEMNRAQQAIAARYYWPSLGFACLHLAVATLLTVSGVICLQGKPHGRKLLVLACGFAIAFELPRAWLTVVVMNETMEVMAEHMERLMESASRGAGPPAGMMSSFMNVFLGLQLAVLGAWLLAKIVFYGSSIAYLRRADIRMHFDRPKASPAATPS